MEQNLFSFIWKQSRRQQLVAAVVTLLSLPLLYLSLELPKTIINEAIGSAQWPRELLGESIEQIPYLLLLCCAFLILVVLNAFIRHRVNLLKAAISVHLLSCLRQVLVSRVLRFPLPQFKKVAPGEIASMVISEVGPFGRFFGDSIAVPVFEGTMFLTILVFVFAQDVYLGIAATAIIPFQAYLVPKLQRRTNELTEEILINERELSYRISEVVDGVQDIHAQNGAAHVLEGIRDRLDGLAGARLEAADRASFSRLWNTILGQVTPFFFYLIGGWLVIRGGLSFGALVATLAAYRDLAAPWKALVDYYRDLAEARTKFNVVLRQFNPDSMWSSELLDSAIEDSPRLNGSIEAIDLSYVSENGQRQLDHANFCFAAAEKVAVFSESSEKRDVIASILSRLELPGQGSLKFAGLEASSLRHSTAGSRIALLDSQPAFFDTTVGENLYLALSSPPGAGPPETWSPSSAAQRVPRDHAIAAADHPWLRLAIAGLSDGDALRARTIELLVELEVDGDIYALGLNQRLPSGQNEQLAQKVVAARRDVQASLLDLQLQDLIQPFDLNGFNTYSTVGENVLFGEAESAGVVSDRLAANAEFRALLHELDLEKDFLQIGFRCAETLVELLAGLPSDHSFFEQYSLVAEANLPDLTETVCEVQARGLSKLSRRQKNDLIRLALSIAPQRHRLGLVDSDMMEKVVALRHELRHRYPVVVEAMVSPYEADEYHPGLSILSNLVFGRIMYGRAHADARVVEIVDRVVDERGLREAIVLQGLEANVGVSGQRLSISVRQKLGVVRSLLKNPDIVVVNDMLNAVDGAARSRLTNRVLARAEGRTLVWLDYAPPADIAFDRTFRVEGGQLVEIGGEARTLSARDMDPVEPGLDDPLAEESSALRNVPLLANLDWVRLRLLAFTSERKDYRAGDVVFHQGSPGEEAYVVLSGSAEVVVENGDRETVLYSLGPGHMVGELAMLCDTPRSATVRAKTALSALRLNREVFFETMRENPGFSFNVARDLGSRLVKTTEQLRS